MIVKLCPNFFLGSFNGLYNATFALDVSVEKDEKRLTIIKTSNAVNPIVWDNIVSLLRFSVSVFIFHFFYIADHIVNVELTFSYFYSL